MKNMKIKTGMVLMSFLLVLSSLPAIAQEKPLKKVTFLGGAPQLDVDQCLYSSLANYLGYWKQEGLDVRVVGAAGALNAFQQVIMNNGQFAIAANGPLFILRGDKGIKLRAVFHLMQSYVFPATLESSNIKSIKDFKGKRIGPQTKGAAAFFLVKGLMAEAGLDPEKDAEYVEVGTGSQAATALITGKVDVLMLWDAQYAIMENQGIKLRKFTSTPLLDKLTFGGSMLAMDDYIEKNPDAVVGFNRGVAKATVFAIENPEAAVRIHWKVYPEFKPIGVEEKVALPKALIQLKARLDNVKLDKRKVKKWGWMEEEEVKAYLDFHYNAGLVKNKLDLKEYYTNKFIDEINNFNQEEIKKQARMFTLK